MHENVTSILQGCRLCQGMSREQIISMLKDSNSKVKVYEKEDFIFYEGDEPTRLFILLSGKIGISRNTCSGKRILITNIERAGDVFGEIYLFMEKKCYEVQAEILERAAVLELSNALFTKSGSWNNRIEEILVHNLMNIFATKAYLLSNKVRILGSGSIREKIACFLTERQDKDGSIKGNLAREDMADYMNVTRPSLSRELSSMAKEGILKIDGRMLSVLDQERLEAYL